VVPNNSQFDRALEVLVGYLKSHLASLAN
jgi:hypothetical protein